MTTVVRTTAVGLGHHLGRGFETAKAILATIGKSLGTGIRAFQVARMMSILCQMSDRELELLGITRQQIPSFAEKTVYGEE